MVIALTTTYRHDYVPPVTSRYRFLEAATKKKAVDCDQICKCAEEHPALQTANAAVKSSLKAEWTGIAPMGRLIEPRIIPGPKSSEDEKVPACQRDQPNRFLKILQTCYPDLYERLKNMPQDELQRRTDKERLRTTYQVDYCHMPEYPEGIYDSMEKKKEEKPGLLNLTDGCENFREEIFESLNKREDEDECKQAYSPSGGAGMSFGDSNRFNEKKDDTSHWAASQEQNKKPRVSEYMDSISRTGCVIVKNNIHDHKRCRGGKNCVHPLKVTC